MLSENQAVNLNDISSCCRSAILVELSVLYQVLYYIAEAMTHLSCVTIVIMVGAILVSCCRSGLF